LNCLRTGESINLKDSIIDRHGVLSCGHLLNERTNSLHNLSSSIPLFDNKREGVIHLSKIRWIRATGKARGRKVNRNIFERARCQTIRESEVGRTSNVTAGTLNPHLPKRTVAASQILEWLEQADAPR
jgi:hypothetical protein